MTLGRRPAAESAASPSSRMANQAHAATAADLDKDAAQALQTLYKNNPTAEVIAKKAPPSKA